MPTSADIRMMASMVREEDLEELQKVRQELLESADKAREDGRVYMMQQYIRLIAVVTPEIDRVQRRFQREALAELRKAHKELKTSSKATP